MVEGHSQRRQGRCYRDRSNIGLSFGQDGRVVVDFGRLTTLDGTRVKLQVDETATEKNKSLELAAGASMAGILLLGSPVGLVGGYFVRGKDVKIEANVPFFVETERATSVSGFYFRPASL